MIIDVFGVCVEGYVENLKGQVGKIVALQALHSCRSTPTNSTRDQWNAKNLGWPYSVKYPTMISMIYQREKMMYFSNKNAITLMKVYIYKKKVDWAQIIFNRLCSELDWWYKYVKENKGDKNETYQSTLILVKIFKYLFIHQKENHRNHKPRSRELERRCK